MANRSPRISLPFAGAHAVATVAALLVWFGAGMTSGAETVTLTAAVVVFVLGTPAVWLMVLALNADVLNGADLLSGSPLGLVFVAGAVANSLLWGWAWARIRARRDRAV